MNGVRSSLRRVLFSLAGPLLLASGAYGQSITDARRAEFTPSVDHSAVDSDGASVVQNYLLQIFVAGQTTPVHQVDLGKPTADADGQIRVDFVALLATPLAAGVTYESRVGANGPGGQAWSTLSNTFAFTPVCGVPTISPSSVAMTSAGGTSTTSVTATVGCAWTAASNAAWLTVTAGASGSGSGTVTFNAAANTTAASRTGTLTVAGRTFTVTQPAGTTCTATLTPASHTFLSAGGSGLTNVTVASGCPWSATSNAGWVTVAGSASGSGNGTVSFSVAANTATTTRTGTITVAGQTLTVTQGAASCTYTVSPTSVTSQPAGGTGTINITTGTGCAWSSSSLVSWITVAGQGSASGTVTYTVAGNTGSTSRTGSVMVAGNVVSVNQRAPLAPPTNLRVVR